MLSSLQIFPVDIGPASLLQATTALNHFLRLARVVGNLQSRAGSEVGKHLVEWWIHPLLASLVLVGFVIEAGIKLLHFVKEMLTQAKESLIVNLFLVKGD